MLQLKWIAGAVIALVVLLSASTASAAPIVTWNTFGVAGDSAFVPPTSMAANITGLNITRGAGLVPTSASNSFNSAGWNDLGPNDYVQLGFNITAGLPWVVDNIRMGTRSSATGPGFINVLASIDGGAFFTLDTLTQPNALFINPVVDINATVYSSLVIRFVAANGTAANGGAIGPTGTWRIADHSPDAGATFEDIIISGTLSVPEPTSVLVLCSCLIGIGATRMVSRSRRRVCGVNRPIT